MRTLRGFVFTLTEGFTAAHLARAREGLHGGNVILHRSISFGCQLCPPFGTRPRVKRFITTAARINLRRARATRSN